MCSHDGPGAKLVEGKRLERSRTEEGNEDEEDEAAGVGHFDCISVQVLLSSD